MNPLRKCISLQTDNNPGHTHINDYLKRSGSGSPPAPTVNRDYVLAAGAKWIKQWVYWPRVQPNQASSFDEALTAITNPKSKWATLDENIAQANADGVGVILTCDEYPLWANEPPYQSMWTLPGDVSATSDWAWFIGYLMLRYSGVHNDPGPSPTNYLGNPSSAKINALEIVNEPNYHLRRVDPRIQTMECKVTEMIQTADAIARWYEAVGYPTPTILAPASADTGGSQATNPGPFAEDILGQLESVGWSTPHPCYWTHHNYKDIRLGETSRFQAVDSALGAFPWTGRGDRRRIWLTEGGSEVDTYLGEEADNTYSDPAEVAASGNEPWQSKQIQANFEAMRNHPHAYMWTQHVINDDGDTWQPGLFWDWNNATNQQGAIRSAGVTFRDNMPGSSTP